MREFLNKIKIKSKKIIGVFACVAMSCALAVSASAAETGEAGSGAVDSALAGASQQIQAQFTQAATDITPIILGILGAGLGIFVIFVAIKLGKKMFKTVSSG